MSETYYRYDIDYDYEGLEPSVICREFPVAKHTDRGVWIFDHPKKRFVIEARYYCTNDKGNVYEPARKRFAWPTKKEALYSFIRRKECYRDILSARLINTKRVLAQAQLEYFAMDKQEWGENI
jgi:hypothetical protein